MGCGSSNVNSKIEKPEKLNASVTKQDAFSAEDKQDGIKKEEQELVTPSNRKEITQFQVSDRNLEEQTEDKKENGAEHIN